MSDRIEPSFDPTQKTEPPPASAAPPVQPDPPAAAGAANTSGSRFWKVLPWAIIAGLSASLFVAYRPQVSALVSGSTTATSATKAAASGRYYARVSSGFQGQNINTLAQRNSPRGKRGTDTESARCDRARGISHNRRNDTECAFIDMK
jgi:hypothetical protein